jgi:hypothetical protein
MQLYSEYITEKASTEYSGSKGQYLGVMGELLVGYYLRGGSGDPRNPRNKKYHMEEFPGDNNITPYDAFQQVAATFDEERFQQACKRAQYGAKVLKDECKRRGLHISGCRWTSKPKDTEKVTGVPATQQEDDSDDYIETEEGIDVGVSLKTSENTLDVQTSNPGAGGTLGAEKILQQYRKKVSEISPQLGRLSNIEERKRFLAEHPNIKKKVSELQDQYIKKIRDHVYTQLTSMDKSDLEKYIRTNVIHAYKTPAEQQGKAIHIRLNVAGQTSFKHKITAPGEDYEDILAALKDDPDGITIERGGDTSINFFYYGKKFASTHVKFNDKRDFWSSIKMSGGDQGAHQLMELIRQDKLKQAQQPESDETIVDEPVNKEPEPIEPDYTAPGGEQWLSPEEMAQREGRKKQSKAPQPAPKAKAKSESAPQKKVSGTTEKRKVTVPNTRTTVPKGKIRAAVRSVMRGRSQPETKPRDKIPWDKIQPHYLKGELSVDEIGKQFNVNPASIKWHAGLRGWKRGAEV